MTAADPAVAICVRELSLSLGGVDILDRVSLTVHSGTIHAVLGPNGAGKTSLLRCLLGAMPHTGEIRIRSGGSARVGYVPQSLDLDSALPVTVRDMLSITLHRRPGFLPHRRRPALAAMLDRTGARHLLDRPVTALSGGELRRVLLAQALEPMPAILLLDEPASNVDAPGARRFEDTLANLRGRDGITIVLVAHDLAAVTRLADRVTAINRGVTYDGPPEHLMQADVLARVFGGGPAAGGGA